MPYIDRMTKKWSDKEAQRFLEGQWVKEAQKKEAQQTATEYPSSPLAEAMEMRRMMEQADRWHQQVLEQQQMERLKAEAEEKHRQHEKYRQQYVPVEDRFLGGTYAETETAPPTVTASKPPYMVERDYRTQRDTITIPDENTVIRCRDPKSGQMREGTVGDLFSRNTLKATFHKAGHFPIQWMAKAHERAEASDKIISIQLEKEGVVVIGQEADNYETHTLSWMMMEHAEVNPVILGIETVEKHLDTLGRLKQRVRA